MSVKNVPGIREYRIFKGNLWCRVLFWTYYTADLFARRCFWWWCDEHAKQYREAIKRGRE